MATEFERALRLDVANQITDQLVKLVDEHISMGFATAKDAMKWLVHLKPSLEHDKLFQTSYPEVFAFRLGNHQLKKAALQICKEVHAGQTRKNGGPYHAHPIAVADHLGRLGITDGEILAAAYLHDTLEDTATTPEQLVSFFGEKVASLVQELTSDKSAIDALRKDDPVFGKARYLSDKISGMSDEARLIKLADRHDNVRDLADGDPAFGVRYTAETVYILQNLKPPHGKYATVEGELVKNIWERVKTLRF